MFAKAVYTYRFDENRKTAIRYSFANLIIERVRFARNCALTRLLRDTRTTENFSEVARGTSRSLQVAPCLELRRKNLQKFL